MELVEEIITQNFQVHDLPTLKIILNQFETFLEKVKFFSLRPSLAGAKGLSTERLNNKTTPLCLVVQKVKRRVKKQAHVQVMERSGTFGSLPTFLTSVWSLLASFIDNCSTDYTLI